MSQDQLISQVLRPATVRAKLGLSKTTFNDIRNAKSKYYDPTFPKAIQLTVGTIGFFADEVVAWLRARALLRG